MRIQTWRRSGSALVLAVMAEAMAVGCFGINASKSVSPPDFLLPGLVLYDKPEAAPGSAGRSGTGLAMIV